MCTLDGYCTAVDSGSESSVAAIAADSVFTSGISTLELSSRPRTNTRYGALLMTMAWLSLLMSMSNSASHARDTIASACYVPFIPCDRQADIYLSAHHPLVFLSRKGSKRLLFAPPEGS